MAQYLVELYETGAAGAAELVARATGTNDRVRYVRSTFLPEDEVCFLLFEARTADAVAAHCRAAGIRFERITEAVE